MLSTKTVLRSAVLFLLLFGLLMAPWPKAEHGYARIFRSAAQFGCGKLNSHALVRFQPSAQPAGGILDTQVLLGNRRQLMPDGSGPAKNVELSSLQLGYIPTALMLALTLATPLPRKRKAAAVLFGFLLVNCFIGFSLGLVVIHEYNLDKTLSLLLVPSWAQGIVRAVHEILVGYPDARLVVVVLLWILATFRRADFAPGGIFSAQPEAAEHKATGNAGEIADESQRTRSEAPCVPGVLLVFLLMCVSAPAWAAGSPSIARVWDEQLLSGIRIDTPNPPVQARNLFSLSVVMYDAWAVYDTVSVGYVFREKHSAADIAAARHEAISYAAYRLLTERAVYSKSASNTLFALDARMVSLGYDTNNFSLDTSTPAGVGNSVYLAVSAWFLNDGARQTNAYADYPTNQGGYVSVNLALITGNPGNTTVSDINRWQPLAITNAVDQNGFPADLVQKFLGAQWLGVRPFAHERTNSSLPWIDPGPQPRLNGAGDAQFRNEVVDVIRRSSELTPDDGVTMDISPGALGNNSLGANDGVGHPLNPATGQPYPPNVVKRGDFARVLAEFWADGPTSETPPGHWNVIANGVADNTNTVKRIGGVGPIVDDLEWDVKVYFAMNAALHDAACAAWSVKRYYDGGRPIEWVRFMGQRGQITETNSFSYSTNGLPLVTNLIEIVTSATAASGGKHEGLPVGLVVIFAWPGQPTNSATQHSGAKWILPSYWYPYQKATFVTPAFPGYISGHSTFSRSAAEVLAGITGSPFFPGGMGKFTAQSNSFLTFEQGPSQTITLQWGTYYDAADQAGLSRLWGGIHVSTDDLTGRITGSQCGLKAWALARKYFDGSIANTPVTLAIRSGTNGCELQFNTVRGFFYTLQSASSPTDGFTSDPPGPVQAMDTRLFCTNSISVSNKFFRVMRSLRPP